MKLYGLKKDTSSLNCRFGCCGGELSKALKDTNLGRGARKMAKKTARADAKKEISYQLHAQINPAPGMKECDNGWCDNLTAINEDTCFHCTWQANYDEEMRTWEICDWSLNHDDDRFAEFKPVIDEDEENTWEDWY